MLGDTLFKIVAFFVDLRSINLHIVLVAYHESIGPVFQQFLWQFLFLIEVLCHIFGGKDVEAFGDSVGLKHFLIFLVFDIFMDEFFYLIFQQLEYSESNISINLLKNRRILKFDCYFAHLLRYALLRRLQNHSFLLRARFPHEIQFEINEILLLMRQ